MEGHSTLKLTTSGVFVGIMLVASLVGAGLAHASDPADPVPTVQQQAEPENTTPTELQLAPEGVPLDDDVDTDKIPTSARTVPMAARSVQALEAGPIPVGTQVVHRFDVVTAAIYDSVDQIPSSPAPMTIEESAIDSMLAQAAQWWSDNTGLAFDFNQNTRYATVNTTCDDLQKDSMAAVGEQYDAATYTNSNRDLLILPTIACGFYAGIADTVAMPPSVFAGGIFEVIIDPDFEYDTSQLVFTTAHEFGHTIGLLHSSLRDCAALEVPGDDRLGISWDGTYLTDRTGCSTEEYGDRTTVMGDGLFGQVSLNSIQKWALSVAREDVAVIDQGTATLTLSRVDAADSSYPRGAVIPYDNTGLLLGLGVEYRVHSDALMGPSGIYLTSALGLGGFGSQMLIPVGDMQGSSQWWQPLKPGETYVSADGRVSVRTLQVGETTATVEISIGSLPGVDGAVSIQRTGDTLTAVVDSTQATAATYQWFRNGQPIEGEESLTVDLPDPNAVYRVEATLTADGREPTTRYSRGIVVDDQRLAMDGSTAVFTFVDENGQPVDCVGAEMGLSVRTSSGTLVTLIRGSMLPGGAPGVCRTVVDLPVTGSFQVTADGVYEDQTGRYDEADWMSPYWQPLTAPLTLTASGATATLFVGSVFYDSPGVPHLNVGTGEPALPVLVVVTDDTGAPVAGVPVTFAVPDGMILTPASPVTDAEGMAWATLDWDHGVQPPGYWNTVFVQAFVPGFEQVALSPAQVYISSPSGGRWNAWLDKTVAITDGVDSLTLSVRVWDDRGDIVRDRPDLVTAQFYPDERTPGSATIGETVWDEASEAYVIAVQPGAVGEGYVLVMVEGSGIPLYPVVRFEPGPPVRIVGVFEWTPDSRTPASLDGTCDDGSSGVADLLLWPTDEQYNPVDMEGAVIVVTAPEGSPLVFPEGNVASQPDSFGRYHVKITSPVPGFFAVTAALEDGSLAYSIGGIFSNGPIDIDASTFTATQGVRLPDGEDSHVVDVDLVTQCHVPAFGFDQDWNLVARVLDQTGAPVPQATAVIDPSTTPGSYTITVASTVPGTYDVEIGWAMQGNSIDYGPVDVDIQVLATVPVEFGDPVPPPVPAPPAPTISVANRTVISGHADATPGTGAYDIVRVEVTYPAVDGTVKVVTADVDGNGDWSVPTPADAVGGQISAVSVTSSAVRSVAVTADLNIAPERAVVTVEGYQSTLQMGSWSATGTVVVSARDAQGVRVDGVRVDFTQQGDAVSLNDSSCTTGSGNAGGGDIVSPPLTGYCSVSYTAVHPGTAMVHVYYDGVELEDSPLDVIVTPGIAQSSRLVVGRTNQPADGVSEAILNVWAYDAMSQPLQDIDLSFSIDEPGATLSSDVCTTGGDGSCFVSVTSTTVGTFTVHAYLDGTESDDSPVTITFTSVTSPTPSVSGTPSSSTSGTPTGSTTSTPTETSSPTSSMSPTSTSTGTLTPTGTPTSTPTGTPTSSVSMTPTGTPTGTATPTGTPTSTPTETSSPTSSMGGTPTGTMTSTPTSGMTPTSVSTESRTTEIPTPETILTNLGSGAIATTGGTTTDHLSLYPTVLFLLVLAGLTGVLLRRVARKP